MNGLFLVNIHEENQRHHLIDLVAVDVEKMVAYQTKNQFI
jgi:hypothetical protein